LTDIFTKTHLAADGQIKTDSTHPDSSNSYLTNIVDDTGTGVNPLRSDLPPTLNIADWGSGAWNTNGEWNAIVPINVYNVREGRISTTAGSPSANANDLYERGVMSVVELNMRNLARWVDGVYDADPEKVTGAKFFAEITYREVLHQNLKVMDSTAISLCMDNGMPIVVFNMNQPGNIRRAVLGERVGSTVTPA